MSLSILGNKLDFFRFCSYFGIGQVVKRVLVGVICLLKFVHHEVAMTQRSPDFAAGILDCQDTLKVLCGLK